MTKMRRNYSSVPELLKNSPAANGIYINPDFSRKPKHRRPTTDDSVGVIGRSKQTSVRHSDAVASVDVSSASNLQFSAVALSAGDQSFIPSFGQPVCCFAARPSGEQSAPDSALHLELTSIAV
jgi:hypothetical protein